MYPSTSKGLNFPTHLIAAVLQHWNKVEDIVLYYYKGCSIKACEQNNRAIYSGQYFTCLEQHCKMEKKKLLQSEQREHSNFYSVDIPTVPHAVRKQRWTYRRKPETVQHSAASSNYRAKHTSGIYTMFPSSQLDVLKEDLFYAHQGCIYLLKNSIKTVMLLTIVMICNIIFW